MFEVSNKVSFNNRKILGEPYSICFEIVNELIAARFKAKVIESHVFLKEEIRVAKKGVAQLPPKPSAKRDQTAIEEKPEKKTIELKR